MSLLLLALKPGPYRIKNTEHRTWNKEVFSCLRCDIFSFLVLIGKNQINTVMKKYDLDERMINFSVNVIKLAEKLPKTPTGTYFANQLIRSASSAALNYAEAQSGDSRKDFIHKIMVGLIELRETSSGLRILEKLETMGSKEPGQTVMKENNELISIFMKSVKTAKKNMEKDK